jgi:chaperone required for assembly of F1-ATPase
MTEETEQQRMVRLSRDRYEKPLPKRFYSTVGVTESNGILLDGRAVKTPMKAALILPNRAIAEAVAAEWMAQATHINPASMPLTKYANTAIDRAVSERESVLSDFAAYAGSDLVCYRAEKPQALVDLQAFHWDRVIADAELHFGSKFKTTSGLIHVSQATESIAKIRASAVLLDPFRLTILYNLTTLTGSALLALMLVHSRATAEQGWVAAHVDEDYQISQWGADEEASHRRAQRRKDYDALLGLLAMLGA